jgi:alanyl-tRNA synthetase
MAWESFQASRFFILKQTDDFKMKTDELREMYLTFFEGKGCIRRPSDVLVPKDDPTVLFTPAGMNQFKNQFMGIGKLDFTRATTAQKCLRTGDITNVGVTAYHHTFFEMLGNFSFGDYFKKESIHWAWEFLTDKKWLGLDPDKLSVTVYKDDDEAYNIWHDEIKLDSGRISREEEDENFWPASAPSEGPDGVCGPCSEIFFHPDHSNKEVEIWNLVFTQFNRVGNPPNNLRPLPKQNIDTGMGLERTAAVLQGVQSNFEIDILKPLCLAAGDTINQKYTFEHDNGRAIRRIADHVRAVTFSIHEGVSPGSEKESYIVRQLLRRALLEGYILGKRDPFLFQLVQSVADLMKNPYPELQETVESVSNTIKEEEEQFLDTIDRGLSHFEKCVDKAKKSNSSTISGEDAFNLHTQEGFLIELTETMAARHNLQVDKNQFENMMKVHVLASGKGNFADSVMSEGPLDALRKTSGATEFLGYETLESSAEVIGIITNDQLIDELVEVGHAQAVGLVCDKTPFYAESGGQVGDIGTITTSDTEFKVSETQKHGDLFIHIGHLTKGKLKIGLEVQMNVKTEQRQAIRRAHSATHLLHHALRETLGEGATQRGSKVEGDAFRFDFAHGSSLTKEEILFIEDKINQCIANGNDISTNVMDLKEAKRLGAMALFGEKYPDKVRVVQMGDYSIEFCGGTHLSNTGQVGFCKIVGEEPVAKGVRRISAMTGPKALQKFREAESILSDLAILLKTPLPEDLSKKVSALQDELKNAKKALSDQSSKSVSGTVDELISNAPEVDGVKIIAYSPENASREMLRDFADQLRKKVKSVAIILGAEINGKVAFLSSVSKDLVNRDIKASDCIRIAAKVAGGGGGGRPDLAEAGGKFPEKIPEALKAGEEFFKEKLA